MTEPSMTEPSRGANARTVLSPCISVCRMNARTGLCEGCLRTIQEIAAWGSLPDEARLRVIETIERRRAAMRDPGA